MASPSGYLPRIRQVEPVFGGGRGTDDGGGVDEEISPRTVTPNKRLRTPNMRPTSLHPDSASIKSTTSHQTRPQTATKPQKFPGPSARTSRKNSTQSSLILHKDGYTGPPRARSVPAWVKVSNDGSGDSTSPRGRRREWMNDPIGDPGSAVPNSPGNPNSPRYEAVERVSRWERFARPTAYPKTDHLPEKRVDEEWLCENFGRFSEPWGPQAPYGGRPTKQRQTMLTRMQQELMYSPIVPLLIRAIVFSFSVIALALGASIRYYMERDERFPKGPSALMAIIVDAVALAYLMYVSYDELRGKPLGLRSPFAKMRLILLDLIFIIFDSANLSLAFEALSDVRESCEAANINSEFNPMSSPICDRQKALASVLLIALIAWVTSFSIGIFR
ncbi:hypothetical protein KEM54_001665 [Ascosphaera aggregata]|nr:hypothetical protein KEM54_001665 [Ascosphaera aggregata]